MKKLFTIVILLSLISTVDAQNIKTPFSKASRNAQGKLEYKNFIPKTANLGISLGYGYSPMMASSQWASDVFNHYGKSYKNLTSNTTSNLGSFAIGFNYFLTPWLELQIPVSMSISDGFLTYNDISKPLREVYLSFTPNIKVSWMYTPWLHIYSRIGIGFILCNRHDEYQSINNSIINSRFALSWQVSPIGIEVGKSVSFFAEAGFGAMGFVQAGVKVRFRKSTKDYSKYRTLNALGTKSFRYQQFQLNPNTALPMIPTMTQVN